MVGIQNDKRGKQPVAPVSACGSTAVQGRVFCAKLFAQSPEQQPVAHEQLYSAARLVLDAGPRRTCRSLDEPPSVPRSTTQRERRKSAREASQAGLA